MPIVRIKRNYQITIPQSLRRKFNLVTGDYVEIEDRDSGMILRPVKVVHPDQEYFYTKEWQKGEIQADKDIDKGDVIGPFETIEDSLKALKKAKT